MARTLKELASEAIAVQDACNLSGVAHGFAKAMSDLCDHVSNTSERNAHPIAMLWADKIAQLTHTQAFGKNDDNIFDAFKVVYAIAGER